MTYSLLPPRINGPGYPFYLDGTLVEGFKPTRRGSKEPEAYDPFYDPNEPAAGGDLPLDLTLVCDEVMHTDYYAKSDGYVVTDAFVDVAQELDIPDFAHVPINVKGADGRSLAGKRYNYLFFRSKIEGIDFEKSDYLVGSNLGPYRSPTDAEREMLRDGRGGIKVRVRRWNNLVLTEECQRWDLFQLRRSVFAVDAFCSKAFKDAAEKSRLEGFDFVPVQELATWGEARKP